MCPCLLLSQLFRNLMLTKCRNKHHCIQPPLFFPTLMYEQTPLFIHPHTHFPGVKPFRFRSSSCLIPTFLLRKCFPDRTNTRPNPKPPDARVRSLLMPEGKARSRKLSKDKGSILRGWRAAWFPTKGGFDNVESPSLLSLLHRKGVSPYLVQWVGSLLRDRTCRLTFQGSPRRFASLSVGVLQGSRISPLLFVIDVSSLHLEIPRSLTISYVDDFGVTVVSPSYRTNVRLLQKSFSSLKR